MTARTGALDKALGERTKLDSNYKASKREEWFGLYADPEWGERLWDFTKRLGRFGSDDGNTMIAFVTEQERDWLHTAPYEFKCAALTACANRQMRVRLKQGLLAIDDPLPGEPDDVFRACKRVLEL